MVSFLKWVEASEMNAHGAPKTADKYKSILAVDDASMFCQEKSTAISSHYGRLATLEHVYRLLCLVRVQFNGTG